jgi:hypothetical protein
MSWLEVSMIVTLALGGVLAAEDGCLSKKDNYELA